MKLWKLSGIFMLATGVIHIALATAMFWNEIKEIAHNINTSGLVNPITTIEGNCAFWFLTWGVPMLFLGQVLHYYIKITQAPAPKSFGWNLLVFSVFGCIIFPISGFWLFIPQALIIIFANRRLGKIKKGCTRRNSKLLFLIGSIQFFI